MPISEEQSQSLSQYGKLLVALSTAGVDYAVVGGLAVIFNGYPRFTLDADVIVEDSPANLDRLLAVLRGWGEGWARELSLDDFTPEEGAIRARRSLNSISSRGCEGSHGGISSHGCDSSSTPAHAFVISAPRISFTAKPAPSAKKTSSTSSPSKKSSNKTSPNHETHSPCRALSLSP